MTTTEPVPLRTVMPGEIEHPAWCSPDHCRADQIGRSHESAPLDVVGLTLTVTKSVMDRPTNAVLMIDTCPESGESSIVVVRLDEVPTLTKALLELYTRR